MRTGSGKGGGGKEADVVGVKWDKDRIEIKHVEVGTLPAGFKKNVGNIRGKFEKDRMEKVKDNICEKMGVQKDKISKYIKMYVYIPWPQKPRNIQEYRNELEKNEIKFLLFSDVIEDIKEKILKLKYALLSIFG